MSTSNPWIAIAVTIFLIVVSGFFVIIEFSLLAARRHRLEEDAAESRAARAALRGINELTIMLAGAQLGITLCTFALGAVTKPAVDAWINPLLIGAGLPSAVAGTTSFVLSLLVVTFLHLVVGEMAPKSFAIAHPEGSAKVVAIPARAFTWVVRPLLLLVNAIANRLVRASGIEPVNSAAVAGYDVDTMRHLVDHSAQSGTLEDEYSAQLSAVLELEKLTVRDLLKPGRPTAVPADATVQQFQLAAVESGHKRILVAPERGKEIQVAHVRDTLLEPAERPVVELARPVLLVQADTPAYEAIALMRETSEQFAAVMEGEEFVGVTTLADLVGKVLPIGAEAATG